MLLVAAGLVVATACSTVSAPTEGLGAVEISAARAAITDDMLNPAVTQATIRTTICMVGYSTTVRPSASVTGPIKAAQIKAYGYSDTNPAHYEEDHVVALELGGAPANRRSHVNLFPEPRSAAAIDDGLENSLHHQVCAGSVSLATAQASILAAKVRHGYRQDVSAR